MNDDRRLHDAFQSQRAAERGAAPPFGRVLARPGPKRRRGAIPALLAIGGAAALLVAAVVSRGRGSGSARELEMARQVMAWRSPTDFLLPAPAPGLFSSVPRIGQAPAGSPLQALDPGSPLGPPVLPRSPRS